MPEVVERSLDGQEVTLLCRRKATEDRGDVCSICNATMPADSNTCAYGHTIGKWYGWTTGGKNGAWKDTIHEVTDQPSVPSGEDFRECSHTSGFCSICGNVVLRCAEHCSRGHQHGSSYPVAV